MAPFLGDITGTPAGLMGHGAYGRKGKSKRCVQNCTQRKKDVCFPNLWVMESNSRIFGIRHG